MPNILITGAASGLGLGFLHAYIEELHTTEESNIYITDCDVRVECFNHLFPPSGDQALQMQKWAEQHIKPFVLDITHSDAVDSVFGMDGPLAGVTLDLVIHSAGVRGLVDDGRGVTRYEDVKGVEGMDVMDKHTLVKAFEINVAGTFELLRGCVPGLKAAAGDHCGAVNSLPKVVVMGSRMGSISNNTAGNASAGGAYAYRASKAALNAVVRSFVVDVPEVIWMVVHPGRVETGLVRVKEDGAMTVEDSVRDMVKLIAKSRKEDSGKFVDRFGVDIPW